MIMDNEEIMLKSNTDSSSQTVKPIFTHISTFEKR